MGMFLQNAEVIVKTGKFFCVQIDFIFSLLATVVHDTFSSTTTFKYCMIINCKTVLIAHLHILSDLQSLDYIILYYESDNEMGMY